MNYDNEYWRHVRDVRPVFRFKPASDLSYESSLTKEYAFIALWTTNESLFATPGGRTFLNFYEGPVRRTRINANRIELPDPVWDGFRSDESARHVYLRVGYAEDPSNTTVSTSGLTWYNAAVWHLNRDPVVILGPPPTADLARTPAPDLQLLVESNVVLDAGESRDPDDSHGPAPPLGFEWTLPKVPEGAVTSAEANAFWERILGRLKAGKDKPTVDVLLPGDPVPPECLGTFRVKVTVTDNDPKSFYDTVGRGVGEQSITLAEPVEGVRILSPTEREDTISIERPGKDKVEVVWEAGPSALEAWRGTLGARLVLEVRPAGTTPASPPVFATAVPVPAGRGVLYWDGRLSTGQPAQSGAYDLYLALHDSGGQSLSVSAGMSETRERGRVVVNMLGFWSDLMSFRPPSIVQRRIEPIVHGPFGAIPQGFQAIECPGIFSLYDSTNLDLFSIRIETMPTINGRQVSPEEFLNYVRLNINSLLDTDLSEFLPYATASGSEAALWGSASPLGALLTVDFGLFWSYLNVDDGTVCCSLFEPRRWIFSTVRSDNDYIHPVSGNREFGIRSNPDGSHTLYTRGADRAVITLLTLGSPGLVYAGGKLLWRSFQSGVEAFVRTNGGQASIEPAITLTEDWPTLASRYYRATQEWVAPNPICPS